MFNKEGKVAALALALAVCAPAMAQTSSFPTLDNNPGAVGQPGNAALNAGHNRAGFPGQVGVQASTSNGVSKSSSSSMIKSSGGMQVDTNNGGSGVNINPPMGGVGGNLQLNSGVNLNPKPVSGANINPPMPSGVNVNPPLGSGLNLNTPPMPTPGTGLQLTK